MNEIVYPVLFQVALTFALMLRLAYVRVAAARARAVRLKDIALSGDAWPEAIRKIGNAFQNQFELPVLFYLAAVLAMLTGKADGTLVALAWAFVLSRAVHAFIHTTSNDVLRRFYAFLAGAVALLAMWAWLALAVLGADV